MILVVVDFPYDPVIAMTRLVSGSVRRRMIESGRVRPRECWMAQERRRSRPISVLSIKGSCRIGRMRGQFPGPGRVSARESIVASVIASVTWIRGS